MNFFEGFTQFLNSAFRIKFFASIAVVSGQVFLANAQETNGQTSVPIIHGLYEDNGQNFDIIDEYNSDSSKGRAISYAPEYAPEFVTFGPENRPFIRGEFDGPHSAPPGEKYIGIQTINDDGDWIEINLSKQAKDYFEDQGQPNWNGSYRTARNFEERVVFDLDGHAYTFIDASIDPNFGHGILMHSKDGGINWMAYVLEDVENTFLARLEFQDGHNEISGPPPLLIHTTNPYKVGDLPTRDDLYLQVIKKDANGDLEMPFPSPILVASDSLLSVQHSGAGNSTVTIGDKTHIVYPSHDNSVYCKTADGGGTPAFGRTYTHSNEMLTAPIFLGCGDSWINPNPPSEYIPNLPDAHNTPMISADSEGYLHVVIGAHQDRFKYGKSLIKNDFEGMLDNVFEEWDVDGLESIGHENEHGYTYVGLLIDQKDTIHIAARYTGYGYNSGNYQFQLVYLRKQKNSGWSNFSNPTIDGQAYVTDEHQLLVHPFGKYYRSYQHKLNLDHDGRLFLNYSVFAFHLNENEAEAYCENWPQDCINGILEKDDPSCDSNLPDVAYCSYMGSANRNSPVILMSDDGGDSWRIAESEDFNRENKGIYTRLSSSVQNADFADPDILLSLPPVAAITRWNELGDVTGDGKTDLVSWDDDRKEITIAPSGGKTFNLTRRSSSASIVPFSWSWQKLGYVTDDNKADLVSWHNSYSGVYVTPSDGTEFDHSQRQYHTGWPFTSSWRDLADVNGDGTADLVTWNSTGTGVTAIPSNGTRFDMNQRWYNSGAPFTYANRVLGDITGDGLADMITWQNMSGGINLATSSGNSFHEIASPDYTGNSIPDYTEFPFTWPWHDLADVDGDGKDDLISWNSTGHGLYVIRSNGTNFDVNQRTYSGANMPFTLPNRMFRDVNGDKKADFIGWGNNSSDVHVVLSGGLGFNPNTAYTIAGSPQTQSPTVLSGDIDKDSKEDVVVIAD